jgi:pyruvate dehydrogenase E1 component
MKSTACAGVITKKIYPAYHAAANHRGQLTVILAQTKKASAWGLRARAR